MCVWYLQDAIDSGWLLQGPRSCVHGKVDALRVMATAAEVAAAVAALHADDVIHGDLAAVNVLLSRCGHCEIRVFKT